MKNCSVTPSKLEYEIKVSKDEWVEEFTPLIKWAGNYYFNIMKSFSCSSYLDREEFVGNGFETLAKCLKWKPDLEPYEFKKYFKTSLFRGYQEMLTKSLAKKRVALEEQLSYAVDKYEINFIFDGFDKIKYEELIESVLERLRSPLEKEIFKILVDPPECLCHKSILENRRRMKIRLMHPCSRAKGYDTVKLSKTVILKYLNSNGNGVVTEAIYYKCKKNIENVVKKVVF